MVDKTVNLQGAAAAPVVLPERADWKLVPMATTTDMRIAYQRNRDDGFEAAYRAMLEAAPAAAPVVLPQPVATLHCNDECYVWARASEAGQRMRFEQPIALFTEQQLRALLATATGLPAQADTPDSFREWFAKNYPADTIIVDPDWHAKSIFRMAQAHARLAAPQAQADARDALIPAKPVHPKGMTSINARLSFNMGWMACERHHGIRAEDVEQAVATDAAIAAAKGE